MPTMTCQYCGTFYQATNYAIQVKNSKYCSKKCFDLARVKKITIQCEYCGKDFELIPSIAKKGRKFCSPTCQAQVRKVELRRRCQEEIERKYGKPIKELLTKMYEGGLGIKKIAKKIGVSDHTLWLWFEELKIERRGRSVAVALQWVNNKERREKTGERLSEIVHSYYANGGISPSKRPEIAAKISQAKKGVGNAMYGKFGPQNPNWKGGKITYRGRGWRGIKEQAIRRDNRKCRRCGSGEKLQVHHIVPYRETQDNLLENLVTLCDTCHKAVEYHEGMWL